MSHPVSTVSFPALRVCSAVPGQYENFKSIKFLFATPYSHCVMTEQLARQIGTSRPSRVVVDVNPQLSLSSTPRSIRFSRKLSAAGVFPPLYPTIKTIKLNLIQPANHCSRLWRGNLLKKVAKAVSPEISRCTEPEISPLRPLDLATDFLAWSTTSAV